MRFRFCGLFITSLLYLSISNFSCSNDNRAQESANKDSPRIKKQTSLKLPKINEKYTIGDSIRFEVTPDRLIDSVQLEIEGHVKTYYENEFSWKSTMSKTGKQRLKITAYVKGESESHYPRVTFLSDIQPAKMGYRIINRYPHDQTSYTQGLFFWNDELYESTGQRGRSSLSKININSGNKIQSVSIDEKYFGEGSTVWNDQIIMLTYVSNIGFIFNAELKQTNTFRFNHQGWGITTYGDSLIISDGSEKLHLLDPRDFSEIGTLEVYDHEGPVESLNELEMIQGVLYANVYTTDFIIGIDPQTGKVLHRIDMTGLLSPTELGKLDEVNEVLNGIAHNPKTGKTYVTGKHWPYLFEVEFNTVDGLVQ